MQPWPPARHGGERRHVLARELDEIRPQRVALLGDAADVAGRVLDADDVLELVEPLHRVDAHVDDAARRDVVDEDRNADGVVDRLEVPIHALPASACCNKASPPAPRRRRPSRRSGRDSIASAVLFEPAPAMTGTRPRASSMQTCTTRRCSSWVSVGLSPVVPTGTRPCDPDEICQSTSARKAVSSNLPSLNGVMRAGIEP